MRRDPRQLEGREFDLAVVGGGVFGICTAWDAALRGLSVALIERADFVQATSAHSFRMVHGGIRYLQHGDFARIRESVRERRALIRMAPHLVEPLPIVIPTYGHGLGGKAALGLGKSRPAGSYRGPSACTCSRSSSPTASPVPACSTTGRCTIRPGWRSRFSGRPSMPGPSP
jgi:glycerol-3-phosphate dehydrogenase